jgi:hypothetical protein
MYTGVWIFIAVVVFLVLYWILSNLAVIQPPPPVTDAELRRLVDDFNSYPTELWFRNSPCVFEKYLACKTFRYIIYESNGRVVYDSDPKYPSHESAKEIRNSYEYNKAIAVFIGGVLRGNVQNVAILAKEANRYRIVHISEYLYSEEDCGY